MHPAMIIYSTIVYLLWKGHQTMIDNNNHTLDFFRIEIKNKVYNLNDYITVEWRTRILYVLTLWVIICYCLNPLLIVIGLTGVLVLSHALMRDPKHIDASSRFYLDGGGSSGRRGSDGEDSEGSEVIVEKMDAV